MSISKVVDYVLGTFQYKIVYIYNQYLLNALAFNVNNYKIKNFYKFSLLSKVYLNGKVK